LADDAEKRFCFANALEARLAAFQWLTIDHSPEVQSLHQNIESMANKHQFTWVLQRLNAAQPHAQ
jgi:hypothetical protein